MYRVTERGWGPPRWEILSPAAGGALVGRAWADARHRRNHFTTRALVCSLWCAGAPWDQIGEAARDLVTAVIDSGDDDVPRREIGLADATRACQLFDPEPALVERLRRAIASLGPLSPPGSELSIHAAALGSVAELERARESDAAAGFLGALREGPAAWDAEVTACVQGGIDRARRSFDNAGSAAGLLRRAAGVVDHGGGVLFAAMRPIGEALGLRLPPPAAAVRAYVRGVGE